MKKSICFHLDGTIDNAKKWIFIANEFIKKEYDVILICDSQQSYDYVVSKGFVAYNLSEYDNYELTPQEKEDVLQYFKQYKIDDIRAMYFTEYQLYNHVFPNPDVFFSNLTIKRLKKVKEITELKFKVNYLFDFAGDELFHRMYRLIGTISNAKIIQYRAAPIHTRMVFFDDSEFGVWKIDNNIINKSNVNKKHILIAEEYLLNTFGKKEILWGSIKSRDIKLKLIDKIKKTKLNEFFSKKKFKSLKSTIKIIYNRNINALFYDERNIINDINFYYFPMHYQRDSQLTLRGKPFVNQIAFVEMLSLFIPHNTYLVVKEHPHARGGFSPKEIKRLKEIKNIIVLNPIVNSHTIIPKSKAVIIINSSVGLESCYHTIPVISFGENYLQNSGLVKEVRNFSELHNVFNERYLKKVSKTKLIDFLSIVAANSITIDPVLFLSNKINESELILFVTELDNYINKNNVN